MQDSEGKIAVDTFEQAQALEKTTACLYILYTRKDRVSDTGFGYVHDMTADSTNAEEIQGLHKKIAELLQGNNSLHEVHLVFRSYNSGRLKVKRKETFWVIPSYDPIKIFTAKEFVEQKPGELVMPSSKTFKAP